MANDLNRSIKIYIDGTPAAQGIAPVEAAIQKLEAKLAALNKSEKDYEVKSKKLKQELESKNRTLQNYKAKIEETNRVLKNLSGATYNELLAVQSQVRKQLREAVPGTEKYTVALEHNRRVSEAMARAQKDMRVEVGSQGTTMSKAIGAFNKYAAVVTAGIAAITGVTLKLNQLREKRNQREEGKADVEALTGLDQNSINWLEQQAKQLSTSMDENGVRIRQSATEILDAYKLVGSAKPELLSNKEALAEVTKQTLILASASGMALKDAVDAVTLSMNQYGAQADQAGRYANVMAAGSKYGAAAVESVTTAVTKSGVAASSAGIPIEQLVGSIETLAEKGIKDEIAGTGLKKFFLTLQTGADETNPKIVGLETALDNLQKKQLSAAQVKKMFGEEGYNVASVLINEAEKVKYYTQAVTGTTVAVEQAATKSATAAAKLDQAKNKMSEMGITLMEKLNPTIVSSINGLVSWGRKFIELVDFITRNTGTIITLTTAIVSYYTATKLAALYENRLKDAKLSSLAVDKLTVAYHKIKLGATLALSAAKYALTGNINMATKAMKLFNVAMKGNLIGIVVSLVATLAMGLYQLMSRTKSSTDALQRFNAEMLTEQRSLDSLFDALKRTASGSRERRDLIQEINDKYGTYLPNLLTEKSSLDEINDAYKRINATLVQQIALKYKNEEIDKIVNEAAKSQVNTLEEMRSSLEKSLGNGKIASMAIEDIKRITSEYYNAGSNWEKAFGQAYDTIKAKYLGKNSLAKGFFTDMSDYMQNVYRMNRDIAKVENKFDHWTPKTPANELPEVTITADKPNKGGGTGTEDDKDKEKRLKAALEKEKRLYTQRQAELTKYYAAGKNDELKTEQRYNDWMLELKKEYYRKVIDLAGKGSSEASDAEKQLADIQMQERKAAVERAIADENALYEQQLKELKEAFIAQNDENLRTQEDYEDAREQLDILHLQRSLDIAGLDAEARKKIEEQLLEFKLKCMKELEDERKKKDNKEKADEEAKAKQFAKKYQQKFDDVRGYADEFGNVIGQVVAGQQDAISALGDTMIDIVFDVLEKTLDAWMTKLIAKSIVSTAEGGMTAIGSKGIAGIAEAAMIAAAVSGLLATAKSGLKSLIGSGRKGSSERSNSTDGGSYNRVAVRQHASGRYDVIGAEDNKPYANVPYIGPAPTGIVRSPALISENGAELIVNAQDLARLQRHVNYPLVVQAINESRGGGATVRQHAAGNYPTEEAPPAPVQGSATGIPPELMIRLANAIIHLDDEGVQSSVVLSELERKQKQRNRSRRYGSKRG